MGRRKGKGISFSAAGWVFAVGLALCHAAEEGGEKPEKNPLFEQDCANCHGDEGQGNDQLKGPAIAALPVWYLKIQLEKFRNHARAVDPNDKESNRMHVVAMAMTDEKIATVAEFTSKQKRIPSVQSVHGNAMRGKLLYDRFCLECHGPGAGGIEEKQAPPLTGYQDWYLVAQLKKFRRGSRGVHPLDAEGIEMHKTAKKISRDRDVNNVVVYILDLAEK